jgi:hypothetical protein
MDLFDIVKKIFDKKDSSWDSVSQIDKSRNYFMINRIMAIQFPLQANQFNHTKIAPPNVVDWWRNNLCTRYTKTPNWIYTKTKKQEKKQKEKPEVVEIEEVEKFIRDRFEISKRDILQLKSFYPHKYNEWVKDISLQIGVSIPKKTK